MYTIMMNAPSLSVVSLSEMEWNLAPLLVVMICFVC